MDKPVYLNSSYKGGKGYGPMYYHPDKFVQCYKGYEIYYRASCYDIVSNDVCIMQMAGLKGALNYIDTL